MLNKDECHMPFSIPVVLDIKQILIFVFHELVAGGLFPQTLRQPHANIIRAMTMRLDKKRTAEHTSSLAILM